MGGNETGRGRAERRLGAQLGQHDEKASPGARRVRCWAIFLPDNSLWTCFLMTVAGRRWEMFRTMPGSARKKESRAPRTDPVGALAAASPELSRTLARSMIHQRANCWYLFQNAHPACHRFLPRPPASTHEHTCLHTHMPLGS